MSKWQTRSQRRASRELHRAWEFLFWPRQRVPKPRFGELRWVSGLELMQSPTHWWRVVRGHPLMDAQLARYQRPPWPFGRFDETNNPPPFTDSVWEGNAVLRLLREREEARANVQIR